MTTSNKAPAPTQKGTMQIIYNMIHAHVGSLNFQGVNNLWPATVPKPTQRQLQTSLTNLVYRGHVVVDKSISKDAGGHQWRIAPYHYYKARQTKLTQMRAANKKKKQKHATYLKSKAKKARQNKEYVYVHANKVPFTPAAKGSGLLREVDLQIASLSAQERGIHNKIDKLRKVRANIAMLEL